jgi:hypothetical protein
VNAGNPGNPGGYDSGFITIDGVQARVQDIAMDISTASEVISKRRWLIPSSYEGFR